MVVELAASEAFDSDCCNGTRGASSTGKDDELAEEKREPPSMGFLEALGRDCDLSLPAVALSALISSAHIRSCSPSIFDSTSACTAESKIAL